MYRNFFIISIVLTGLIFIQFLPVSGQEEQKKTEWTGKLGDGTAITKEDLFKIIEEHNKWLKTDGEDGKLANFSNAKLNGAVLRSMDLRWALLRNSELTEADLSNADLSFANLRKANLYKADLREANLTLAKLSKANLEDSNLSKVYLRWGNLNNVNLKNSNLSEANLSDTSLDKADFSGANLSNTNFQNTSLKAVKLFDANLKGALFYGVKQFPNYYEPKPGATPYLPSMATIRSLSSLTFKNSPHGLVDLREGFKKLGYRKQEREITYAIKYTQRRKLWNNKESNLWNKAESLFYFIFFEITCKYGMNSGRPLVLLIPLIIIFAIPYTIVLKSPPGKDGIWVVWIPERARKDLGAKDPYRLNLKLYSALGFGFYFSILSAFSIGWRELNVGNWIARVQRREYTLRATGWVRTVSGIQSLISVYLVALWVLSYFGRPFDAI